jgi:ribosome biogenesis GTPase
VEPPPEVLAYAELGYPLTRVSCTTGTGLPALVDWLGSGTVVLVGQSGVGKSSLLNRLAPAAAAATGSISRATGEGRHTTTASVLHRLVTGGRLIDTPGVRDFVPPIPDRRRIGAGFREIARESAGCRFLDCSHLREPGCAVRAALEQGRLDPRRFESYRRLVNLASQAAARGY